MYLAIEWTSAAFHAWKLSGDGDVTAEYASARGVNSVANGAFEEALREQVTPLLDGVDTILLSGMITSRTGWVESPFAMVPASPSNLAEKAVYRQMEGLPRLFFLPGIARSAPVPDVMRGEELAILGIEGPMPPLVVLPGMHGKWVRTNGAEITDVSTFMSGEVLNLLGKDSLVAKLIPATYEPRPDAFARGVAFAVDRSALSGGVLQRIFSARSLVLFGQLAPEDIADYLEGLLLGSEIAEALEGQEKADAIPVLGESPIAGRYREALGLLGIESPLIVSSAAQGFARVLPHLR
jgi:2-dehydro-3-deoxygalactonokinase